MRQYTQTCTQSVNYRLHRYARYIHKNAQEDSLLLLTKKHTIVAARNAVTPTTLSMSNHLTLITKMGKNIYVACLRSVYTIGD